MLQYDLHTGQTSLEEKVACVFQQLPEDQHTDREGNKTIAEHFFKITFFGEFSNLNPLMFFSR